jgi:hypothetical protein
MGHKVLPCIILLDSEMIEMHAVISGRHNTDSKELC